MRGVPNNPIKCSHCGRMSGCAGDGLCHRCRIQGRPPVVRKFIWTDELDTSLRRAYQDSHTRGELSSNLNELQRRTGFTRNVLLARAVQLRLAFSVRRTWTTEELRTLEESVGQATPKAIAATLQRTHGSVKAKMKELGLSARVSEGYTRDDLRQLLGVSARSIKRWLAMGWLRMMQERIPEASVIRFLRLHSEEYHLGRVDQAWFKGLLFPSFNFAAQRLENTRRPGPGHPGGPETDLQPLYFAPEFGPEMDVA